MFLTSQIAFVSNLAAGDYSAALRASGPSALSTSGFTSLIISSIECIAAWGGVAPVRIAGRRMYLWRAVDHEGDVLKILVQHRRDKCAAVKLMCKLFRKHGFAPKTVTTDKLRSHGAALPASLAFLPP